MELYPEVNAFSRAVCNGLRNVCVLSSTNHAQRWDLEQARSLMRTALNYRHDVMSAASKRDFEANLREARAFKDMLEERDRVAGREGQQEQQAGKGASPMGQASAPAQHSDGVPPPPPPEDPLPSPSMRTGSAANTVPQHLHEQQGVPPAPPPPPPAPLSRQPSADAAAAAKGFKFKIVVTSTDQDIKNPHQQQAAGAAPAAAAAADSAAEQHKRAAEGSAGAQAAKRARLSPSSEFSPPVSPHSAAAAAAAAANANGVTQQARQQQQQEEFSELPEVASLPPGTDILAASIQALLQRRRLCLVLDLDHTLVNSARFSEVAPEHATLLESRYERELALPQHQRELFRVSKLGMWTKLRPGLREFLRRAHEHFELWIHTAGNRCVALQHCCSGALLSPVLGAVPASVAAHAAQAAAALVLQVLAGA